MLSRSCRGYRRGGLSKRLPPLSILDLARSWRARRRPTRCATRSISRSTPSGWGYTRFWLAEHHNWPASRAPRPRSSSGTSPAARRTIRVGAGGIMLPNHSPLVIAEQFGTLESLYPGRIDLGLGRAPGTDQRTLRALRRDRTSADTFPQDVVELQALLGDRAAGPGGAGGARHGLARAALDSRLEPLRRAARRRARPAVRVRVALRARRADAGARDLPRRASSRRRSCSSRTRWSAPTWSPPTRRGGAAPLHVACSRRSRTSSRGAAASCRRRSTTSRRTGRPAEKAQRVAHAALLVRRLARRRCGAGSSASSTRPAPTS